MLSSFVYVREAMFRMAVPRFTTVHQLGACRLKGYELSSKR